MRTRLAGHSRIVYPSAVPRRAVAFPPSVCHRGFSDSRHYGLLVAWYFVSSNHLRVALDCTIGLVLARLIVFLATRPVEQLIRLAVTSASM